MDLIMEVTEDTMQRALTFRSMGYINYYIVNQPKRIR